MLVKKIEEAPKKMLENLPRFKKYSHSLKNVRT